MNSQDLFRDLPIKVISRDEVEIGNRRLSRDEITQFSQLRPNTTAYIAEVLGWREILRRMDELEEPKPWYCSTCKRGLRWYEVTFQETHDERCAGCGNSVLPKKDAEENPFGGSHWNRNADWVAYENFHSKCIDDLRKAVERLEKGDGK